MTPSWWTCPCGTRNERVKQRCISCRRARPKRRVPAHARTLRDDSYTVYERINGELHGTAFGGEWTPDCCGVCGKPPTTARHMDRDHDHTTGLPRGLACPGNTGCNALMPRQMTLERARLIVGYLERAAVRGAIETTRTEGVVTDRAGGSGTDSTREHDAASGYRLWLVATRDGRHPKVISAASGVGALLSRVKDDEDVPKGGVWAVWALGNFPEQFEVDLDDVALQPLGRPSVKVKR